MHDTTKHQDVSNNTLFALFLALFLTVIATPLHSKDRKSSDGKCTIELTKRGLPRYLCYKKKKVNYTLTHYSLITDFDSRSIKEITFLRGDNPYVGSVEVFNTKNQRLKYQVVLKKSSNWNGVYGYSASRFYQLYDYYPDTTYYDPDYKTTTSLLKVIRFYNNLGEPGKLNGAFKIEFVIKNVRKFKSYASGKIKINGKPDKLVFRIRYRADGTVIDKKYIPLSSYYSMFF